MGTTNNAFIRLQESANGRVSVKLQKNNFATDGSENFWGKVERYTYSTQNILDAFNGYFVDKTANSKL